VPDLNALKLFEVPDLNVTYLGQVLYIYGRFGGHVDTMKHINAIWRAQDAMKREHEGASRGDGVLF
jgi:hypothetical protein